MVPVLCYFYLEESFLWIKSYIFNAESFPIYHCWHNIHAFQSNNCSAHIVSAFHL